MSGYTIPIERRKQVFERDGWACAYCGAPLTLDLIGPDKQGMYTSPKGYERATVDHVIPRSKGGHHKASNLVAACRSCNSRKGVKILSAGAGA